MLDNGETKMMELDWDAHEVFTEPQLAPPKTDSKKSIMDYVRNAKREIASLPKTKFGKAVKKRLTVEVLKQIDYYKRYAIKARGRSR